ncbi:putative beta-1,3-galactosyltransferase 16 [Acorus gramineus]|uniref:Beta-1,3-galactosyltransferase 16 n=1 Tax=Acorus gramineus TaxID=55184 RepID=A0AAV9BKB1_ACOGR|nr:putative beta-1,3-galactosyltransferase 16 [Acorus gramineus]
MKPWCGGTLIVSLALFLLFTYSSLLRSPSPPPPPPPPSKPNASTFFKRLSHNAPPRPVSASFEGIDLLFSSAPSSDAQLVWPHMRHVISRSDALPNTADGVREASVAWTDLSAAILAIPAARSAGSEDERRCPYSVSDGDGGGGLVFPCGLVRDSSVTLVGVVSGGGSGFRVEVIGSNDSSEAAPPLLLHYNVSLGGEPAIAQNTWTERNGWGAEERCPSRSPPVDRKVDGLVKCNERINGSSSNFPFIESQLFTANLWVHDEGFHMTVNGKHETSFSYRENLEPWLASGVRVEGDLEILSLLANGLPVSGDLEVDVEALRAPAVAKKKVLMVVGVFSTVNNFERRMALRRSWMQYGAVRSGDVVVRFFTGLHKNTQVNLELWKESQAYGDIQLMPFVDYYSLITLKTVAICIFGTKILPAKYIMKTDDDAFVRIDEVVSSLEKKSTHGLLYGLIAFNSEPHRDKESKWYISEQEWPRATYPPWAHGPGYVITHDIAKFIVRGHKDRYLPLFKLEDVAMGIWIQQFKDGGQEVEYADDDRFHNSGCEENYVLAHYQGPRMMLCLWEKLLIEKEPVCCE